MARLWLPLAAASLLLAGCLHAEEDYAVAVDGLVYDETFGQPVEGVHVVMAPRPFGWFIEPGEVVARAETDAAGRYRLDYDPVWGGEDYYVQVNFFPFDPGAAQPDLSADGYGVRSGDRVSRVTTLYRYATLEVRAETDGPPSDEVTYYLTVNRSGRRDGPLTDAYARANAFNHVQLVVDRGGDRSVTVDSVYCPLGVVTEYVFRY